MRGQNSCRKSRFRNDNASNCDNLNIELVLVNDYPNTPLSLSDFIENNLSVKVVENMCNFGIHGARVNGLRNSSGAYVMFLDQDDEIDNCALIKHYNALNVNSASLSNGKAINLDQTEEKLFLSSNSLKHANKASYYFYFGNVIASPGLVLIKKECVSKIWINNPMKISGADDWLLWTSYKFVAGSCFAAKPSALKKIQKLEIAEHDFKYKEKSRGLSFAHFLERYVCISILEQGYKFYGNKVCTLRRKYKKPFEKIMWGLSSNRLLDEDINIDSDFFLWQLDNKFVFWRYKVVPFSELKYTRNYEKISLLEGAPYKYLKGDTKGYKDYCDYHETHGLPIMSIERFECLRRSIHENGFIEKNIIIVGYDFVIMDGQHRACCLCFEKGEHSTVRVLQIFPIDIKYWIKAVIPLRLKQKIGNNKGES